MQGDSIERSVPGGEARDELETPPAPLRRRARAGGRTDGRARPIAAALGKSAFRALGLLPLRASHGCGGFLGGLSARIPSKALRTTRINLALCFPERSERERRELAVRSLVETGRMALELGAMWSWEPARLLATVREAENFELVDELLAQGRGALFASPHLGAWELAGLYCSSLRPLTAMYRAPHMPEMEEFYKRARERFGARLVPANAGGIRALHRALERGEMVGILPDQDPGPGSGIFVPFFGVLANTTVLLSRLAQRTGAPVAFAFAERLPRGRGFKLRFRRGSPEIHDPDLAISARAVNADVERCVRELPEQYLWSYKRFRIRPPGEVDPYRNRAPTSARAAAGEQRRNP